MRTSEPSGSSRTIMTASQLKYTLRVAAAHGLHMGRRQRVDTRQTALHVADIMREVGAVHELVRPADVEAEVERVEPISDRIVVDAPHVATRLLPDAGAGRRPHLVHAIEPSDDIGQRRAGV